MTRLRLWLALALCLTLVSGASAQVILPDFPAGIPSGVLPGNFSGFAAPTAAVGLAAVPGSSTTAMRSDAAPALDQGISPTMTGPWVFSNLVSLRDGSADCTTLGLAFSADPDTGLVRVGTNSLGICTGGSLRLTLDGSGNALLGAAAAGAGLVSGLVLPVGTAPSTSGVDTAQLYVTDRAAGKACFRTRTEDGTIHSFCDFFGVNVASPAIRLEVEETTVNTIAATFAVNSTDATRGINLINRDITASAVMPFRWTHTDSSSVTRNAGAIVVGKEAEWTSTISTKDSFMDVYTSLNGTMTKALRIPSTGHLESASAAPAVSACGTTPAVVGTDTAGKVTIGTGGVATSCTITFAGAYTNPPACWCMNETTALACKAISTTSTLIITSGSAFTASDVMAYGCIGRI